MGGAASRATGRSYAAAEAAAAAAQAARSAAAAGEGLQGAVAADAQRAAQVAAAARRADAPRSLNDEEGRDASFGGLLDRLGGAIHSITLDISPRGLAARAGGGRGDADASASASASSSSSSRSGGGGAGGGGRLPPHAFRELLQLQRAAEGGPVDAAALAARYGADPQLMQRVLERACLPEVLPADGRDGVTAHAVWPEWFERRRRRRQGGGGGGEGEGDESGDDDAGGRRG